MKNNFLFRICSRGYYGIIFLATLLQPFFLLAIRLYWGWQFFETGKGKLTDIHKVVGFFQSLGIPYPELNARLAGCTECFGGLLLLVGLGSRIFTVPLIFTMCIAYWTASHDVVVNIFKNPDAFVTADPFLFMLAAVIVFLFGPGIFSVDGALGFFFRRRAKVEFAAVQAGE